VGSGVSRTIAAKNRAAGLSGRFTFDGRGNWTSSVSSGLNVTVSSQGVDFDNIMGGHVRPSIQHHETLGPPVMAPWRPRFSLRGLFRSSTAIPDGMTRIQGTGAQFASQRRLTRHFGSHGADFGARTAAQYQRQADRFLTGTRDSNTLERTRPNGDVVRFNTRTNEYGVVSRSGIIRTYYRPDPSIHGHQTNMGYFLYGR
jgi:hypothetical protein